MFDHLVGNLEVRSAIRRYLTNRRVPNALLFAGPEGVGKKQFALELARALVCSEPRGADACGACSACGRVGEFKLPAADAKGEEYDRVFFSDHLDVGMVVPFNRTLRVGSIRALESEANFRPYEASARIFVINDAHRMNASSSNALLKTLEEPPTTSHIFLVTSKPDSLLPTIRSRVQTLRFGPVGENEIRHLLLTTHKYSQPDAQLIASTSGGSVAGALTVDIEEFRERRALAVEILRKAIVEKDLPGLLRQSEKIGARSVQDYEAFLDLLEILIHQIWSASLSVTDKNSNADISGLASKANPARLASWIDDIEAIRNRLAININKKVATDDLVIRMAA
jgi:DNA polymerase-3 subunit delta'